MPRARVIVDNQLHLVDDAFSMEFIQLCAEVMELDNKAHYEAKEADRWGWQEIPERIQLWKEDDEGYLAIPRGFALELKKWMREDYGLQVRWIDRTTWEPGEPFGYEEVEFRGHQFPAIEAIKKHRQGMYRSPTGSGKSGTAGGLIWLLHPKNSLILVDRINLVDQWEKDLRNLFGSDLEIGTIGSGKWSEGRITIATVQTLWKQRERLHKIGWFKKHSIICLDECHHATARTYRELMNEFWARIRFGQSATPDKTGDFAVAEMVLGPVFHEDQDEEIREAGFTLAPQVRVVHTPFYYYYWGDHHVSSKEECDVPGCKKIGTAHGHRNNYQNLKRALIEDPERNLIIAEKINEWHGDHQLVITTETNHLDCLAQYALQSGLDRPLCQLIGKHSDTRRKEEIAAFKDYDQAVMFSTIAGEGLNIPEIDCVHLPFPTGNPKKREQELGRATRISEGKRGSIIFDYADTRVPVLAKQFKRRRHQCYERLGLEVKIEDEYQTEPRNKNMLGKRLR